MSWRVETEQTVIVAAVLHAARHDRHWQRRVSSIMKRGLTPAFKWSGMVFEGSEAASTGYSSRQ